MLSNIPSQISKVHSTTLTAPPRHLSMPSQPAATPSEYFYIHPGSFYTYVDALIFTENNTNIRPNIFKYLFIYCTPH